MSRGALAAAALAFAACRAGEDAPWLTAPTPEAHARYFPVSQGTAHAGATCDDCHGGFDTFKRFDCIHCHDARHTDPTVVAGWHAGVPGFTFTSESCYGCHRDGRGIFVNHAAFFPTDAGTAHGAVACSSCHLDRTNRLSLGCAGCHPHDLATAEAQHLRVAGYAFDSGLCVRCHAEAQVDPIASHLPFRLDPGAIHAGPDLGGTCLRCHPSVRADKPWAADFTVRTCEDCHVRANVDAIHVGKVPGYAYTTAACYGCHPSGKGGAP